MLVACGGAPAEDPAPLLFVGVDGLDPELAVELIEAGRMPHLAALAERGVLGSLASVIPSWSPVIWTTIATGQDPRQHGIRNFLEPASGLPYTSNTRRVPALWNLASDAGLTVDMAGWWITWPAEEIEGRVVASYAAQAQMHLIWKPTLWKNFPGQTWPLELADEIEPLVTYAEDGRDSLDDLWNAFPQPPDGLLNENTGRLVNDLAWTFRGDHSYAAVGRHFLEHDPADLVLLYLSLPDVAGHRFWRYHDPQAFSYEIAAPELEALGGYVERSYELFDEQLGELLALWPDGANVLVVSDHGMHADIETLDDPEAITSGHHQTGPSGLFAAAGPAIAQAGVQLGGERNLSGLLGDVKGVAPLVLRLLHQGVPEHWDYGRRENPLEDILDPDWARAHRGRTTSNPDPEWRERHPPGAPIDPGAGQSELYIEAFTSLGYLDPQSDQ